MTGHSFITLLFTRKNSSFRASYVITLFLRHCTCAVLSSFSFQSEQVFTCPLVRITKGINHPLRSDPIQSDWRVYMQLFYSDCALVLLRSDCYGPCKRSYCLTERWVKHATWPGRDPVPLGWQSTAIWDRSVWESNLWNKKLNRNDDVDDF